MAGAAITWTDGMVALATYLNALPRGVMGFVNGSSSDQASISTETDITSLAVVFTAISSRLYRTMVYTVVSKQTGAGNAAVYITDATNSHLRQATVTLAIADIATVTPVLLESGISGSTTRKARAASSATTITIAGVLQQNSSISVEDMGPA